MTGRKKMLLGVAIGGLTMAAAASASAATFIVDTTSNAPKTPGVYTTFNNRTLGNTTQTTNTGIVVSFTGAGAFVQGQMPFQYDAPIVYNGNGANFDNQPDGTNSTVYVSTGIGSATLTFINPTNYFGLLWGSVDAYNSLTFFTADGLSQTFNGTQVVGSATSMPHYVNFTSNSAILRVVASSTSNSFEFDNVATGVVPEPATWAMMIAGFSMVGFAMRRRRQTAKVTFAA